MIRLSAENREKIGLEYVFSLMYPASPYGRAALRELAFYEPSRQTELEKEFDCIAALRPALMNGSEDIKRLRHALSQLRYIPESLKKLRNAECLETTELFELKSLLLRFEDIYTVWRRLAELFGVAGLEFADTEAALDLIDMDGMRTDGFHIPDSASAELAEARAQKRAFERSIAAEQDEEAKKRLLTERTNVAAKEAEEELRISRELCRALSRFAADIQGNTAVAARIDLLLCKAELAEAHGGVRPKIGKTRICYENMINPHAEALLRQHGGSFTPLSIELSSGATVITGANMGGKTMALKTAALNTALCQLGFFPFAERAEIVLVDGMYLLLDDNSAAERGLSSFGGEVEAINEAVSAADREMCFIAIDEPARGTNPIEGAAIAAAVVQHLNSQNTFALISTHYNGIASRAGAHYQIAGLEKLGIGVVKKLSHTTLRERVAYIGENMDYSLKKVEKDAPCPHEAMNICRMMELNSDIIDYAENVLTKTEQIV
ncbi:MAG: hypothetical protein IJU78_05075 [Clostridia bacterium]|nr:hypothetical protein [Clostridia bacterium]